MIRMALIITFITLAAGIMMAQAQSTPSTAPAQPAPHPSLQQGPQNLPTLQQRPPADTSASVPPDQAVVTIHGACAEAQKSADPNACTTVITKEQFDKLIDAINSNNQPVPPTMRRNLAQAYVELLAFAQAAEKAGIPNDAKFQEIMKLVRMRTLADLYRRNFEEQHKTAPQQDVQAYYDKNVDKYQELKLGRIFIPKNNPTGQDKADFEKKAEQVANQMHERAVKGEALETLQKEAYTTLGLTSPPPSTEAGTRRKGMLQPQEEAELFTLKSGEVSKVESGPSGFIIYKLESKQTLPLDQLKEEISRELFRQTMEGQMKAVMASVHADYNDQYFGPATPPAGAPGAAAKPPATPPPSASKPSTPAASSAPPKKAPPK